MAPLIIPVLNKPMSQKIYEYVRDCPGCTSRDISADLDMRPQTARAALKRLQNKQMIHTDGKDTDGLVFWFLQDVKRPALERITVAKQETVTSWPALEIPKQGPFSALFLSK